MKTKSTIIIFLVVISFGIFSIKAALYGNTTAAPAVAGWYFRAVSGYPAAISFEPVVLFKNGEYYDVGEEPFEKLNVAADKSKRRAAWGTWKKTGETFYLTNYKGKTADYKLGSGNWFPAYAYNPSLKLNRAYEKVSGGDYGNGVASLSINKITFIDATHFTQGLDGGITTPNAAGGSKKSGSGIYKISGHSITFMYDNGKTVNQSFAIGAKGSPATPDPNLIFIGGSAFTDTE